jgi:molecular chaperone DnaK
MPQVEVTFDIDANGIVNVSAKDKATGKEQQIRIQASGGLSDSDINRMVKEAEEHSEEDKKRRELVEARNTADALAHSAEKNLKEFGDKVSADEKTAIEAAVKDLRAAAEKDDVDAIKSKTEALATASMKLGEAMYKASQAEAQAQGDKAEQAPKGGAGAEAKGGDGKVVDADFEEVDPESEKEKDADFEDSGPDKKKKSN